MSAVQPQSISGTPAGNFFRVLLSSPWQIGIATLLAYLFADLATHRVLDTGTLSPPIYVPTGIGIGFALLATNSRARWSVILAIMLGAGYVAYQGRAGYISIAISSVSAGFGALVVAFVMNRVVLRSSLFSLSQFTSTARPASTQAQGEADQEEPAQLWGVGRVLPLCGLLLLGAPLGCAATVVMAGVLLIASNSIDPEPSRVVGTWIYRMMLGRGLADYLGVLLITPVMLQGVAWARARLNEVRLAESAVFTFLAVCITAAIFTNSVKNNAVALALAALPIPVFVSAAMRIGPGAMSALGLLVSIVIIVGTQHGRGPIAGLLTHDTLTALGDQAYIIILIGSTLLLSASTSYARQSQNLLEQSEARYRDFIDQSSEGVWRIEFHHPISTSLPIQDQIDAIFREGYFAECNMAMAKMYSMSSQEDLLFKPVSFTLVQEDPRNQAFLKMLIESGYRIENVESVERDVNGQNHIILNSLRCVIQDGMMIRAWGSQRDVTSMREAAAKLEQSEKRLRAIIDASPHIAVKVVDVNGVVLHWNNACERIFGYSASEAIGKTCDQLMLTPELTRSFHAILAEMDVTGKPVGPEMAPFHHSSGKKGKLLYTIYPVSTPNGINEFICIDLDVTAQENERAELAKMHDRLRDSQKLESLGLMAGGVAHDFNNLLVGIMANAAIASDVLDPHSPATGPLATVQEAARRATELTRQLLAYAGKSQMQPMAVDLNAFIDALVPLMNSMASEVADVEYAKADEHSRERIWASVDTAQLQQIVMNLVLNGVEACRTKVQLGVRPVVQVRTGRGFVSKQELDGCLVAPAVPVEGEYVYIEVSDGGSGITQEHMSRLFDPFFTTKFTGRGLGLAVVQGIVRGHLGAIAVSSIPGTGTTFKVYLPTSSELEIAASHVAMENASHRKKHSFASRAPQTSRGGFDSEAGFAPTVDGVEVKPGSSNHGHLTSGSHRDSHACKRVLVVDDEPLVRDVIASVLRHWGWEVTKASDAEEGLKTLSGDQSFNAGIFDVTMPGMSGIELCDKARKLRPEMVILLSSGYSEESTSLDAHADGFIQKPFLPEALIEALDHAIESRSMR